MRLYKKIEKGLIQKKLGFGRIVQNYYFSNKILGYWPNIYK